MGFKPYWKENQEYKAKVMELFKENPSLILSIKDVSEKIGCSIDCAKNILLELTAEGKIVAFKLRRMWAFHDPSLEITTIPKEEPKVEVKEVF